jgi:hypothetical protein
MITSTDGDDSRVTRLLGALAPAAAMSGFAAHGTTTAKESPNPERMATSCGDNHA